MGNRFASGIYRIEHKPSGRMYIGSSNNMGVRWRKHAAQLCRGKHHSAYLQNAWTKHGSQEFIFSPVLVCAVNQLKFYEQLLLDGLQPVFNMAKSASSPTHRGQKLSPDRVEKAAARVRQRYADGFKIIHPPRSNAYRGYASKQTAEMWSTPDYRASTAAAIKAAMTPEECKKKSERVRNLWATPEYRERATAARKGNAYNKGYKCTPEQVLNRQRAARISNMKRNYGSEWAIEYAHRYPEFAGDVYGK